MSNSQLYTKLNTDLWYPVRRYYIDDFFLRHIAIFPPGQKILDMGGKKRNKRGEFDIEKYELTVEYANLDTSTEPDYVCDIAHVPLPDEMFDGIILSEVLEHVPDPKAVLREAYRLLKTGGRALICTPFMINVHADPCDFARYTDYWYKTVLTEQGFQDIFIEKQGLFFSVLANMLKAWGYELLLTNRPAKPWKRKLFHRLIFRGVQQALIWDNTPFCQNTSKLSGYTTGYGVICKKSPVDHDESRTMEHGSI